MEVLVKDRKQYRNGLVYGGFKGVLGYGVKGSILIADGLVIASYCQIDYNVGSDNDRNQYWNGLVYGGFKDVVGYVVIGSIKIADGLVIASYCQILPDR